MEQLERPEEAVWDERRLWFEAREAACGRAGARGRNSAGRPGRRHSWKRSNAAVIPKVLSNDP